MKERPAEYPISRNVIKSQLVAVLPHGQAVPLMLSLQKGQHLVLFLPLLRLNPQPDRRSPGPHTLQLHHTANLPFLPRGSCRHASHLPPPPPLVASPTTLPLQASTVLPPFPCPSFRPPSCTALPLPLPPLRPPRRLLRRIQIRIQILDPNLDLLQLQPRLVLPLLVLLQGPPQGLSQGL